MKTPESVADLTELGRIRLSEHFFMRDMLYSEVANFHGLPNMPDDPDLAIESGSQLCERVLEPLHSAFGGIIVRSAFRSAMVNDYCYQRISQNTAAYYCGDNTYSAARHIWDLRDADGYMGATASIVIPWYIDRFEESGDFRPLAWWICDHLADYAEVAFFPWLCAFNIRWYEGPSDKAITWSAPDMPKFKILTQRGIDGFDDDHSDHYPGFPQGGKT